MAQLDTTLYKNIAGHFANSRETIVACANYIKLAQNDIVDVTTTGYPPGAPDADEAAAVELDLLSPINSAYTGTLNMAASTASFMNGVRALNNYIIRHNTSTTDTDPLTTFVNAINWTSVSGTDCIPYYWAELSELAGYNIDDWRVCVTS